MYLQRFALIVVIAAIACEVSWADTQYETAAMDIHTKNYNRAKKSLENIPEVPKPDGETNQMNDKQITKREDGFDYSTLMDSTMMDSTMMDSTMMIDSESHGEPQKRHLQSRYYNPYLYGYPHRFRHHYRRYSPRLYNPVNLPGGYSILNSLVYGGYPYPYYGHY